MLHRIKKWLCLIAALSTFVAIAENNPTVNLQHRDGYDRAIILRQFQHDPPALPPKKDSSAHNPPNFIPLQPPAITAKTDDVPVLGLVLPLFADGLPRRAAAQVHRGCVHGIRQSGHVAKINLYATDGSGQNTLAQYAAAATSEAQVIIGPMLKSNVEKLLQAQQQAPRPTILLQPRSGNGYFAMTLDAGQEAADIARLLAGGDLTEALVIEQPNWRGAAQSRSFVASWRAQTGATPQRFIIVEQEDWQQLFNELKEVAEEKGIVLFAAGDDDFARKVRSFTPQRHRVFAASIVSGGGSDLSSERLSFMEMPWFVGLDDHLQIYDLPAVRTASAVQQRFFALGIDVCRAALAWPLWSAQWTMAGVSGDWLLDAAGIFARRGKLVSYRGGSLRPLSP